MINLTSIFTAIKGASLAAKISLGISAVVIVGGSTAGIVTIINTNHPQEKPEISANHTDNNSSSNQNTAEDKKSEESTKEESTDKESAKDNSNQTTNDKTNTSSGNSTSKPSNNSSTPSSSQSSNNSSTSNPTTSTTKPTEPSQPTKKPDYNLNDRYVAGYVTMSFPNQDENGEWYVAEEKQFFGVTKFTGSSSDLYVAVMPQYIAYAEAHGYPIGGGMGAINMTWEDAVRSGTALDEAKCAQYGLSCGRW